MIVQFKYWESGELGSLKKTPMLRAYSATPGCSKQCLLAVHARRHRTLTAFETKQTLCCASLLLAALTRTHRVMWCMSKWGHLLIHQSLEPLHEHLSPWLAREGSHMGCAEAVAAPADLTQCANGHRSSFEPGPSCWWLVSTTKSFGYLCQKFGGAEKSCKYYKEGGFGVFQLNRAQIWSRISKIFQVLGNWMALTVCNCTL